MQWSASADEANSNSLAIFNQWLRLCFCFWFLFTSRRRSLRRYFLTFPLHNFEGWWGHKVHLPWHTFIGVCVCVCVCVFKSCINRRKTSTFSLDTHSWHNPTNSKALSVQFKLTASCVYTGRVKGWEREWEREKEDKKRKCRRGEQLPYCVHTHAKFYISTWFAGRNNQQTTQQSLKSIKQAWLLFMEIRTQWSGSWSTDTEGSLRSSGNHLNGSHSAWNESWISETQSSVGWCGLLWRWYSPHLLTHKVLTAVVTGERRRQVRFMFRW